MNDFIRTDTERKNVVVSDKAALRKILEEQDKKTGFVMDLSSTPQEIRATMIAQGVKPEKNSFSCKIRRSRKEP